MSELWKPEADEDALRAICTTLNDEFGKNFFAHMNDNEELVVQIYGKTVWCQRDGTLSGFASMPHDSRI